MSSAVDHTLMNAWQQILQKSILEISQALGWLKGTWEKSNTIANGSELVLELFKHRQTVEYTKGTLYIIGIMWLRSLSF